MEFKRKLVQALVRRVKLGCSDLVAEVRSYIGTTTIVGWYRAISGPIVYVCHKVTRDQIRKVCIVRDGSNDCCTFR